MWYGVIVNLHDTVIAINNFTVETDVSVDSEKLYQQTDLLCGTEEQIISVYKIKEHFF